MDKNQIRKKVREQLKENLGGWIKGKAKGAWQGTKDFGKALKRETKETLIAAKILGKVLMHKNPSSEEVEFLKSQSVDFGKAIALLGLQAIPGSSVAVIVLEKFLKKHGMTIFPKAQNIPGQQIAD